MRYPKESYTHAATRVFRLTHQRIHPEIIFAYLEVKEAACCVNWKSGRISSQKKRAILNAIHQIRKIPVGSVRWKNLFLTTLYQPGAGTALNMNVNDAIVLIAGRTGRKDQKEVLHANDDVNASQSSNDTYPTAVRLAAIKAILTLQKDLRACRASLRRLAKRDRSLFKAARTHLQDALPISLSFQWASYDRSLEKCSVQFNSALNSLLELPVGGTAIGNGATTPKNFRSQTVRELRVLTQIKGLRTAVHGGELQSSHLDLLILSQSLECLALCMQRICSDLRLQASGPKTGLQEIQLLRLLPGSSIMPGKTNPGALEALHQLVIRTLALGAQARWAESMGQLELNVMLPAWSSDLISCLADWSQGVRFFRQQVLEKLIPNAGVLLQNALKTEQWATLLSSRVPYQEIAQWVKEARSQDLSFLEWLEKKDPQLSAWLWKQVDSQLGRARSERG